MIAILPRLSCVPEAGLPACDVSPQEAVARVALPGESWRDEWIRG